MLGVETEAGMARIARERGFQVETGRFEDWVPADRLCDAVFSGQAWHWVDPEVGAARAATALRSGGSIALFWNIMHPAPGLAAAFGAVYRRVETGLPFDPWAVDLLAEYGSINRKVIDGIGHTGAFRDVEQLRFDWERDSSREEWLDIVPTSGGHHRIPPEKLDELLAGIGEVIDAAGGGFTMGYATLLLTATRR